MSQLENYRHAILSDLHWIQGQVVIDHVPELRALEEGLLDRNGLGALWRDFRRALLRESPLPESLRVYLDRGKRVKELLPDLADLGITQRQLERTRPWETRMAWSEFRSEVINRMQHSDASPEKITDFLVKDVVEDAKSAPPAGRFIIKDRLKIPFLDHYRVTYRCIQAIGDGKCFFHAVAMSLNISLELLMTALRQSLLNPPSEDYGMRQVRNFHDHGPRRITGAHLDDATWFDRVWVRDMESQADLVTMAHVMNMFARHGVGIIVLDNSDMPTRNRFDIRDLFARAWREWAVDKWLRYMFRGSDEAPLDARYAPITHYVVINKSEGHYDATQFLCGDGSWSFMFCVNTTGTKDLPWMEFRNRIREETERTVANDLQNHAMGRCDSENLCTPWIRPREFDVDYT